MSATTAAPRINRKQNRAEVDGQIQKSIPMYLQAALCKGFEKMRHALRWGDVSLRDDPVTSNERLFLKVGSSRGYQDYDQEQGEHPLQPGAVRLNKFFAKYGLTEAKKAHSLLDECMYAVFLFVAIAMVILRKLYSNQPKKRALIDVIGGLILIIILHILGKNRAFPVKNNRGREAVTGNMSALHRLLNG